MTVVAAIALGIGAAVMWPRLRQSPWDPAHRFPQSFPLESSDFASPTLEGDLEFFAEALRQLREENEQLTAELSEVLEELAVRKSEVSFSYGTVQESGVFVGRTLRLRLEIANAPELQAGEMRRLDNQLDILSLGPFIRDAEVLESDPVVFAQFQSALIGEMLQTDAARRAAIAHILQQRKAEALEQEEDDQAWLALNEQTADEVVALFNEAERSTLVQPFSFLREHGMLMIPAYSVLE